MESFSLHDDAQYLFTSCAICPHGGSIEWIWRIVRDDCISLPLPDYAWDSCLFWFFYFIVIVFFLLLQKSTKSCLDETVHWCALIMFNYESGCDCSVLYTDLTVHKKNWHRLHHQHQHHHHHEGIYCKWCAGVHLTYSASALVFKLYTVYGGNRWWWWFYTCHIFFSWQLKLEPTTILFY